MAISNHCQEVFRGNAADTLLHTLALPCLQLALSREAFCLARYLLAALVDLGEAGRASQTKPLDSLGSCLRLIRDGDDKSVAAADVPLTAERATEMLMAYVTRPRRRRSRQGTAAGTWDSHGEIPARQTRDGGARKCGAEANNAR